ncbi:MAG: 2Fe-2S iron-sulfur cluster binding domain-containing protein [Colwellia sp.]|nr:2Fe-2S iron-sulfur cluster binding domain-containing protein [Colwellia sp.]
MPLNKGEIKQGDKLEILTLQKPPTFSFDSHFSDAEQGVINTETSTGFASTELTSAKLTSTKLDQVPNKKVSIYFKKWQKKYQGDNQKTLLEHGEAAGLILPYSCLAGMCGSCKAKLVSGEVQQSSTEGLTTLEKQQGYILCCSAIATSDVIIEHE